ncbi:MAG TPA: hypothetical protein DD727_00330 [Clostridiales bacterium]|nr:hypothetical protein [Clostridiales bacterium]
MERKKANDFIKSKLLVRLFSILMGIVLWFAVLNIVNPDRSRQLTIPLTFLNTKALDEAGLGILSVDYPREVTLTLEGRNAEVSGLLEKDFTASVDMKQIVSEGEYTLRILVNSLRNANYRIKSMEPADLKLTVEPVVEKLFNVDIQLEGRLPDGYEIIRTVPNPADMVISSLRSLVASVDRIIVPVDVNGLDRSVSIRRFCRIYNRAGEEIPAFKEKYSVDTNISIARRVGVLPVITGKPAGDSYVSTRTPDPETVLVTGSQDVLSELEWLNTYAVDISGIAADTVYTAYLELPEGVTLVDPANSQVSVTVSVGTLLTMELSLEKSGIRITGADGEVQLAYEILTPSVVVRVKGLSKDLEGFTIDRIQPAVNVKLLKTGVHRLPLEFQGTDGVSVIGSYFVEVSVTEKAEETPEVSPSPNPGVSPGT